MTIYKSNGDRVPDHILAMAEEAKAGKVDRREFLDNMIVAPVEEEAVKQ